MFEQKLQKEESRLKVGGNMPKIPKNENPSCSKNSMVLWKLQGRCDFSKMLEFIGVTNKFSIMDSHESLKMKQSNEFHHVICIMVQVFSLNLMVIFRLNVFDS